MTTALLTIDSHWLPVSDGNREAAELFRRHYSARRYADGRQNDPHYRNRNLIIGPGEKLLLLAVDGLSLFGFRKFIDDSGQRGVNNCIFRREGGPRASELIHDACTHAWQRWPGERLYTYVDPCKVRSRNPGHCYFMAGWHREGVTQSGKLILAIDAQ